MPAPVLHLGATVLCSHAGRATPTAPFPRVTVSGQPITTLSSPYGIIACALTGTTTAPCVTGQFVVGSSRVFAGGASVITMVGQSVCTPTGTPMLPMMAQTRVLAT
jgi:hypothetical protein